MHHKTYNFYQWHKILLLYHKNYDLLGLTPELPIEWPWQNFSIQYQYKITQASNENKEKYQFEDYQLIKYKILQANIIRIV